MRSEIGSDFWQIEKTENKYNYTYGKDMCYLLSGRTALDFIIRDVKAKRAISTAYLPSYCCQSMIEPFLSNGIDVLFYDVIFEDNCLIIKTDEEVEVDIALVIQYFGFQDSTVAEISKIFSDNNTIVIEDCTHSIFCNAPFNKYANYCFSSFRKWTGLECGAFASCIDNNFVIEKPKSTNDKYIKMRTDAIKKKSLYITGKIDNKEYLALFNKAEELLDEDYHFYSVGEDIIQVISECDIQLIKAKRRNNAKVLIKLLSEVDNLELIFRKLSDSDCPLFIPIYVKNNKRNQLRQYLIEHSIYCPVHWALSDLHEIDEQATRLYENELSLICDQRYDKSDMKRIAELILNYFRK